MTAGTVTGAGTTPDQLQVAEVFGPTVQGEGPSLGRRAVFVRLMRCNLTCKRCDTPETWDASRFDLHARTTSMPVPDLVSWALAQPVDLVVITGGEPFIQQRRLVPLVQALSDAGRRVEIETNGTVVPLPELAAHAWFNVSPKVGVFGASDPESKRIKPAALRTLQQTGRAVFKFVITKPDDLDDVARLADEHGLTSIWCMPEGTTPADVVDGPRAWADDAIARGFHVTTRLHVLLWDDAPGR
ncbi:7-carboxy-7-deazaguanine synthase QueE [Myceligenerans crystallogenes]|uniref:7-carboxy-7-deazaguanine synthase n=1 Tax=Myceligenerans crystallogenes TaxID=316335 RepID=A0ABN2NLL0_9MICO